MRSCDSSSPMREGMSAAEYLERRNTLLNTVKDIDAEIYASLSYKKASNRAAARIRELFEMRRRIGDELYVFGIDIDAHPALKEHK